ncbi:MAG TPA: xanthine dehydrogenase family protein molybdopterin-binding subunit [Gammaproteobacteria bacterium]|nr:xanthine dehydrogenase family protein molybdopterin-binding subunit [Gammaproteobacteria bacterium]
MGARPVDRSRRHFLKVSAVAGGLMLVGFSLDGCAGDSASTATANGGFAPNAWIRIAPDDGVTIIVAHSEMGQGVMTALPMLVAEELEVDLDKVDVEFAPAQRAYDNPALGLQATGGSTSVRTSWLPLREAGATARAMLITAAARHWKVDADGLRARSGRVFNPATGDSLAYRDLAAAAARLPVPEKVRLKEPGDFRLIGTPYPRVDVPSKVDGSAVFGLDIHVPGLLIATVERGPGFGAAVRSFNADAAMQVAGVRHVVQITTGVAVVADSFWQAQQGRRALSIRWDQPNAGRDSAGIAARYRRLAQQQGAQVRDVGDAPHVLDTAAQVLDVSYQVPFLAHATMEPMNATAHVRADGCDVWVPTQNQGGSQDVAVAITGLPYARVRVHTTQLGGGFGRRSELDFVAEAVQLSQRVGAPVKVIWTREDDTRHDFYRPAMRHRLRAGLDASGRAVAWMHRVVGPSISARAMPAFVPAVLPHWVPRVIKRMASGTAGLVTEHRVDNAAVEGARDVPYAYPNIRVEYVMDEDAFVPVGFWRSVGHSHTAFAVESFVDELAHRAGEDPVAYRRHLLRGHPRRLGVLDLAARKAGWGASLAPRHYQGVAVHECFGSYVAEVAEVSVSGKGKLTVHRVVCAVDCGHVVNPDTIRAQVESAVVYGLSAAILPGSEITIEDGRAKQDNFDSYQVLRMDQMPRVDTWIVQSNAAPGGVGEIATPPIAPAVANAVFAATGKRVRSLPIRPEALTA